MATPDWLASTEQVVGANHPIFANTKDRCGQTINTLFDAEHDGSTGTHDSRVTGLVFEQDSFAGNGAARTITLSNTGLLPISVFVWEERDATELVTNGGFDSDTSSWTNTGTFLFTSVAGGVSGNCGQVDSDGGTGNGVMSQGIAGLTIGQTYTVKMSIKSGTVSDDVSFCWHTAVSGIGDGLVWTNTTTGSWVEYSADVVATATTMYININFEIDPTPGTLLIDSVSMQVTAGNAPSKIDKMVSDKSQPSRFTTALWQTDIITNLQVGSFDVENGCNTSGVTNHYIVIGVDNTTVFTGDSGAGSDPDWIESSTSNRIIADNTATVSSGNIANDVESQIWTQFTQEHGSDGTHLVTIAGHRILTGTYAGNDVDGLDLTLALTDLDVKFVEIYVDNTALAFRTETMPSDITKVDSQTAYLTNYIISVGTGTFRVGAPRNASGYTYNYLVIGV